MRKTLILLLFVLQATTLKTFAAESKPAYKWVSANEFYFLLPAAQNLRLPDIGDTESVQPWGFGFRAVGNDTFSETGGVQFQSIKVDNPSTGRNTFYLWEFLLGMEYMSPKVETKPLRFTASAFADLGLANTKFFAAPVISAGLIYATKEYSGTPIGLTFDIYYRLTDIDLDDAGNGNAGTLRPALGFKLGYIFEGFWTTKDKK